MARQEPGRSQLTRIAQLPGLATGQVYQPRLRRGCNGRLFAGSRPLPADHRQLPARHSAGRSDGARQAPGPPRSTMGLLDRREAFAPAQAASCGLPRTSSSAAFSSTSCPTASTASVTTASSPKAPRPHPRARAQPASRARRRSPAAEFRAGGGALSRTVRRLPGLRRPHARHGAHRAGQIRRLSLRHIMITNADLISIAFDFLARRASSPPAPRSALRSLSVRLLQPRPRCRRYRLSWTPDLGPLAKV